MSKKQTTIICIVAVLAVLSIAATAIIIVNSQNSSSDQPVADTTPEITCPSEDGVITYDGEADKTALELLEALCEVKTTADDETAAADKATEVTSIDGTVADEDHYWAFYVNDVYMIKSAADYITTDQDTIKWRLETFSN